MANGDLPTPVELAPEDGSHAVWGQLQVWTTVTDEDATAVADAGGYGDPEADPGFSIPRGRIGFAGTLPHTGSLWASYGLAVGVGTPYDALTTADADVQLVDAFGRLSLDAGFGTTVLTLGQHKVAFGREQLMSSLHLVFQERAVIGEWLSPGRGTGVTLGQGIDIGDSGQAAVRLGVFNGNQSFLGDTDPGMLLSARGEIALGDTYRTWSHDLENALGVGGNFMSDAALATSETAIGADLLGRFKWITFLGEFSTSTLTPTATDVAAPTVAATTIRSGIAAQLSAYFPVSDTGGLEVAGRLGTFDDASQFDDYGDVSILHAGMTWRDAVPAVDLGAGYILRNETQGAAVPNNTIRIWTQFRPQIAL
jgi:hypothetical protein